MTVYEPLVLETVIFRTADVVTESKSEETTKEFELPLVTLP